jgi:hypothetical protein
MQPRKLPDNCVRGRIRRYIERHADKLGDDVLEVGSRMTNDLAEVLDRPSG